MSFLDELKKENIESIEDSIYLDKILNNSIIKSINNRFVKVYRLEDINYQLSDIEGKESILNNYMNLFNNLDKDIGVSIILSCKQNVENYFLELQNYELQYLRDAINETIDINIHKKGKCNTIKKYICVDIEDNSEANAIKRFSVLDDILKGNFYEIGGCDIKE